MNRSPAQYRADDTRTAASRQTRRLRRLTAFITLSSLVLMAGAYMAACAVIPLPALQSTLEVSAESRVETDQAGIEAAIGTQALPTAIAWAHTDEVWASDEAPHPLASLSKLVTVLVCQEAEPLEPGATGPSYTWTEDDVQRQAELQTVDGVAFPIPAGTEISLRDMLKLIFLPSANDFTAAYAYSVFGDNETFIAAVDDWAARHGLDSLTLVEPTGMDGGNQASAGDLAQIARLVLENPTLTEFAGMREAEIPGIGLVENTNPLVGEPGILGLKTGRSSVAGYNLIVAQTADVPGRELVKISVTMGRASLDERAASGREMLGVLDQMPQPLEFVSAGERVGSVTTWTGGTVPLLADLSFGGVLVPGEGATRAVALQTVEAGPAGSTAGSIEVESPFGTESISVVTGADITEPDFWWRLSHPTRLLGWWAQSDSRGAILRSREFSHMMTRSIACSLRSEMNSSICRFEWPTVYIAGLA